MTWVVNPTVVWLEAADEVRLYDTAAGEFQTLNATAAAIWRRLVTCGDPHAIVASLAEDFGAEDDNQRGIIANDTAAFVHDLAERGIILEQPVAAS